MGIGVLQGIQKEAPKSSQRGNGGCRLEAESLPHNRMEPEQGPFVDEFPLRHLKVTLLGSMPRWMAHVHLQFAQSGKNDSIVFSGIGFSRLTKHYMHLR